MKNCYVCGNEMNDLEVLCGQVALEIMAEAGFEGWVHCQPSPEEAFDIKHDSELMKHCASIIADGSMFDMFDGSIIVCVQCVREQIKTDSVPEGEIV